MAHRSRIARSRPPRAGEGAEPSPADKLALEEQRIADKYKHLEDVLLRMAELARPPTLAGPPC